jgi:hypothetical protein
MLAPREADSRMLSAALIIVLLAVAGSLASWLFSQWSSRGRPPTAMLVLAGTGALLLTGAAGLAIIAAASGWKPFIPVVEALRADANSELPSGSRKEQTQLPAAPADAAAGDAEQPLDFDTVMALELAAGRAVPARWLFIERAASSEWPATPCMKTVRDVEATRWLIDNECQQVIGVVVASCQESEQTCDESTLSAGWTYEPEGVVMTSTTQKPVRHRLGGRGPLIASTHTVEEPGAMESRIDYLACFVTAPEVLALLDAASQAGADGTPLAAVLRSDACYSRVLEWSQAGQRDGQSPDALLRTGVD